MDAIALRDDAKYRELIASHFNCIYPQNELKMCYFSSGRHNADYIAEFAKANNLALRGHCLLWHHSIPMWLKTGLTQDEAWVVIEGYFRDVLTRYPEAIAWDIVNEAFCNEGFPRNRLRHILGSDYITRAFKLAHSIAPDVPLFYCDNQVKFEEKWDTIIKYLQGLRDDGVPIHGVALQMHSNLFSELDGAIALKLIRRLQSAGFLVHCPEIVVWNHRLIPYGERRQGEIYNGLIEAASNSELAGFWAPFDKYPWCLKPQQWKPGLWDSDYLYKGSLPKIKDILSNFC